MIRLHWLSQLVRVVKIPETRTILPSRKISENEFFFTEWYKIHEYMLICHMFQEKISCVLYHNCRATKIIHMQMHVFSNE